MAKQSSRFKISFGVILFALVFIYLIVHMISYASRDTVSMYKIGEITSLSNNDSFTGLIIREESVFNAQNAGIINYYHQNNSRCSVDDVVYTIDEKGTFNDIISSKSGTTSLSEDNLTELTNMLSSFSLSYNGVNFENAYTLKSDINNTLIGYLNVEDSSTLESMGVDTNYFHIINSESSGILEYYTDGYESFDINTITDEDFDQTSYEKNVLKSGVSVGLDDTAYKLITSDKWSIIIKLDDEMAEKYKDSERLNIEFTEYGLETTALFEEFQNEAGDTFGKITLSKYMIQYANTRYLNLKIKNDAISGLKIPKTALTSSEFYTIPIDYVTQGGNKSADGFNIETATTNGTEVVFTETTIVYKDDEYAYVSKDELTLGAVIDKPDSTDKCAVSSTASLPGVFYTNKGYATFKLIEILDEDDEYVIARSGTSYGVTVYDYIVLEADTVYEGYKIY